MDDRLQRAPIGMLDVSADGTVSDINETGRTLIGVTTDPTGATLDDVVPRSVDDTLLTAFEGASVTEAEFEEYYPDLDRWLAVSVVGIDGGGIVYLRDVTARRREKRSLEQLRQERKRTGLIDDVLSDILAALVDATSREEIAETICRGLGETELYEFAWVGERDMGRDELVVRAVAGETGKTFEAVRDAVDDGTVTTPEERAVENGRLRDVQPLTASVSVPESVRTAGFADGVQSALAIPLVYGPNVHGVVGVYADGTETFSDRERASFETLGEVAGFAITAVRNRNLLLSDRVAEITFELGEGSVLTGLSRSLDATLQLEGMVPQDDDTLLCFVSVEDGDVERIEHEAADVEAIAKTRIIDDSESGGTVGITVRGGTPLLAVAALGGTVRRATFEGGTGRLVADLPPDGDVRRIVETISHEYDAEFVAKEERERSVTTAREFRDELDDRLTERQQTVLRTAYLADYFESPRGSTAEEVAASLDITGSTLLHHLRASQRKLLDAYLAERTGAASGSK
ncbi:bacterio-opsin activator domain-containing protein [Haloplanus rubicundus]|uniref:Histidine kinase n=1 Tax=Haloplanus rubicundus TaxID=1547898 RepID=A0A345EEH7_9EURY|nr:bacterio-opsin activator domain-containing protein [Haloplanus rubicundus]AXG10599.1 histidine kinase [Haloplanus rubicundus]